MTAQVWFLIFMFAGKPVASGPHDLETCLYMASVAIEAHCWNPRKPWDRQYPPKAAP